VQFGLRKGTARPQSFTAGDSDGDTLRTVPWRTRRRAARSSWRLRTTLVSDSGSHAGTATSSDALDVAARGRARWPSISGPWTL